jgi:hypothetical protein
MKSRMSFIAWLPEPINARLILSDGATCPFFPRAQAEIMVGTAIADAVAAPESRMKVRLFSSFIFIVLPETFSTS